MSAADLYVIDYLLHAKTRSFVIRTANMNNAEAWQWASCDAGISLIARPGRPPLKRYSKPMAERFGLTEVQWRASVPLIWEEDHAK